jgi:hypothetical protein
MKKIIFLAIFLYCSSVNASEITGKISTNMKPIVNNDGSEVNEENNNSNGGSGQRGGSAIIQNQTNVIPPVLKKERQQKEGENNNLEKVKVLGISNIHFDDGMLIRGQDMKVYVIEKGMKRYISGMKELSKYAGREMFNVDDEVLSRYKNIEKKYSDRQLIRGFGEAKVYVIKNGKKSHIINYEELKKNYFGLEIFNVSLEEIIKY